MFSYLQKSRNRSTFLFLKSVIEVEVVVEYDNIWSNLHLSTFRLDFFCGSDRIQLILWL